jgi:hypothetical protein
LIAAAFAVVVVISYVLIANSEFSRYSAIATWRSDAAQTADRVRIAVVWRTVNGKRDQSLYLGASLAAAEINGNAREPFTIVRHDERGARRVRVPLVIEPHYVASGADEDDTARRIARDPGVLAVVGHTSSPGAERAAVAYEYMGLLFFATSATSPPLTEREDFQYVFRTAPNDYALADVVSDAFARNIAARAGGQRRIAILHSGAPEFVLRPHTTDTIAALEDRGIQTIYEHTYSWDLRQPELSAFGELRRELFHGVFAPYPWRNYLQRTQDLRANLTEAFRRDSPDLPQGALIIDDVPGNAWVVIKAVRAVRPDMPLFGEMNLAPAQRLRGAECRGEYVLGENKATYLPTGAQWSDPAGLMFLVTAHCPGDPPTEALLARMRARYKGQFDESAALQAYEAVRLLAQAFSSANSAAPNDVATRLVSGKELVGLEGRRVSFLPNGDIVNKSIFITSYDPFLPRKGMPAPRRSPWNSVSSTSSPPSSSPSSAERESSASGAISSPR